MKKICNKCNLELDYSNFGIRKASKDGLAYTCNECRRKYRQDTFEHRQSYRINYYCDPKNIEKRNNNNKNYKLKNPNYWREWNPKYYSTNENKLKRLNRQRLWIDLNRDHVSQYVRMRRDLVSILDCNYTIDDYEYTKKIFNGKCFRCGSIEKLCVDHHMPLSKGFGLSRSNAVILCKSCNSCKKNKHPLEFYTEDEILRLSNIGIETPIRELK